MTAAIPLAEVTPGESRWSHGRTVDQETRALRFTSISQIERADNSTDSGCLRKWWWSAVMGIKEPDTDATVRGKLCHADSARFLRTGDRRVVAQVARGIPLMPPPGPDLFVEHSLVPLNADGVEDLTLAMTIAGVPLTGAIDCMHERLTNKGAEDVEDTQDPPGTVEVLDWKFPKSLDYAKKSHELPRAIQMAVYGMWVFHFAPQATHVRLSHGAVPVKGTPRKATIRVTRDQLVPTWEHAASVVRSMVDAARETDPDKVLANTRACRAFHRDCIHKSYCRAGMHNSLASIIGPTAAAALIQSASPTLIQIRPRPGDTLPILPNPSATTSVLSRILATPQPQAPQLVAPPQVAASAFSAFTAPQAPPPPQGPTAAQLQAEEAAARAAQVAITAGQSQVPALIQTCTAIQSQGRGFPTLKGAAAIAVAQASGQPVIPGMVYAGQGEIAPCEIEDPALLAQLLAELIASATPPPPALPDTGLLPPEVPPSQVTAQPTTPAGYTSALAGVTAERPKRTRKKAGAEPETANVANVANVTTPPSPAEQAEVGQEAVTKEAEGYQETLGAYGSGITILVDCNLLHGEGEQFDRYAVAAKDAIAQQFGAPDIRCGPSDGPLGFGRWKGVLGAAIREVTAAALKPGTYVYQARGSETGEVIAEALRDAATARGWTYVRGAL